MKVEELKLYNKYKNINISHIEYIYIGIDKDGNYWFLIKDKNFNASFASLEFYNFNPNKIVKNLNLEIGVYSDGDKFIRDYDWEIYLKEGIEKYFKPILKDKLNNIINR